MITEFGIMYINIHIFCSKCSIYVHIKIISIVYATLSNFYWDWLHLGGIKIFNKKMFDIPYNWDTEKGSTAAGFLTF